MGGDAIKKPAVVRNNHSAASEILQPFFKRTQGVDIQIIGWLIEQQHIRAAFQHLGKMNAVALAAGKRTHFLLLVGAAEIEAAHIGPRIELAVAKLNDLGPAADFFPHRLVRVERGAALVDIAQGDGFANLKFAFIGRFLANNHAKQRSLASAVWPNDTNNPARWQLEFQVFVEQPVAIPFGDIVGAHNHIAQARPRWNKDFQLAVTFLGTLAQQRFVGRNAGLVLGGARRGRHAHPFEFALERLLAL